MPWILLQLAHGHAVGRQALCALFYRRTLWSNVLMGDLLAENVVTADIGCSAACSMVSLLQGLLLLEALQKTDQSHSIMQMCFFVPPCRTFCWPS